MLNSPCHIKPPPLGYSDAHTDAERRMALGQKQLQCEDCGLWYWPDV